MSASVRTESLEPRRLMADTLSAAINPSQTFQTVDAIGGAVNSGYQLPEYKKASYYNQVFGDLGLSAVRSALDPGWELTNDNKDPNTINWAGFNDGAIANTMEYFVQAKARGVKTFLLSVWSPSAWMKTNKASRQGGELRPDLRDEYAEYITAAILRAHDKWGIDITQVSIANEPYFVEPYPSTLWTPDELTATIKVVAKHFAAAGITTQIVGPEDVSSLYRTTQYAKNIAADPVANASYSIIGTHYLNDQDGQSLAATAANLGKKIWFTEAGDGSADFNGALGLARGVDSAFVRDNASAWFNWQISGATPYEALIATGSNGLPNPKYYALRQFAHYIKPGFQRIGVNYSGDAVRVAAFKDPVTGNLTIVMSSNKTVDTTVNLSLAGTIPASFGQVRTSATENGVQLASIAGAANMSITLPAGSIVTLYSGPDTPPLTNTTAAPLVPVPQYADAWNTNPLRMAAETGDYATVQSLVMNGADVNAAFGNQWTPLFTAAASPYNKADLIENYLIQHGADITHKDVEGFTALHVAAMNSIPAYGTTIDTGAKKIQVLLDAGIPVNALDGYGRTALIWAAMLPKEGPDLNAATADTTMLQALLNAGADPTIKDFAGMTALDYAIQEKATAAIALLSAPGAAQTDVFLDNNANGVHDAGDTALANVNVYIDLNNNDILDPGEQTGITDANGVVSFSPLPVGNYVIRATSPDATYTPAEAVATIAVASNATTTATLAFLPPTAPPPPPPPPSGPPTGTASLSGYVSNDKNANGKWDGGEGAIAGRTVYIDWNTNGTLDAGELTAVTGSNGKYTFTGLGAASYTIREVVPAGATQTGPTNNAGLVVTLVDGTARGNLNFTVTGAATPPPPPPPPTGTTPPAGTATLSGTVVNDKNANGKWDSGEGGVSGRTVYIDWNNNGTFDTGELTAVTGSSGKYTFAGIGAATYVVRTVLPPDASQVSPAANAGITYTLVDGTNKTGLNFLTTKTVVPPPPPPTDPTSAGTASIHAYVVNDANKDGKWGSGEKGISGVTVWLDTDNDGTLDNGETSQTTGVNGTFTFTALAPGTYNVRQVLQPGYVQTSPFNNGPLTITLTTGQTKSGNSLLTATA